MMPSDDIYGQALAAYYYEQSTEPLWLHTSYGTREEMPVPWLFREPSDFPELEQYALSLCRGRVLDVGAGVGPHSLALQEAGHEVIALEQSITGSDILRDRGGRQVRTTSYRHYEGPPVNTILLLMNGIGLVGTLPQLSVFLEWAENWLLPGGQLLFDSSDVSYLFEKGSLPQEYYYGEVQFQYEYRERYGEWFSWLYVDYATLADTARKCGWRAQQIYEDDQQQYLARLTLRPGRTAVRS